MRSRQHTFLFNINAHKITSATFSMHWTFWVMALGWLSWPCVYLHTGWLIQDKYCIQIIVWKKSGSSFYHNGDPIGSRKTLFHCYAHFTTFQSRIAKYSTRNPSLQTNHIVPIRWASWSVSGEHLWKSVTVLLQGNLHDKIVLNPMKSTSLSHLSTPLGFLILRRLPLRRFFFRLWRIFLFLFPFFL